MTALAGSVFGGILDGLWVDWQSLRSVSDEARPSVLDQIHLDPANVMKLVGMEPDPWQERSGPSEFPPQSADCH
jgi:hypothetical protein